MAIIVYMEYGLHLKQRPEHCLTSRQTATTAQLGQISNSKPVADLQLIGLNKVSDLLYCLALALLLVSQLDNQPLSHGSTQGVYCVDLCLRKLLSQIIQGNTPVLVGSTQAGREGKI